MTAELEIIQTELARPDGQITHEQQALLRRTLCEEATEQEFQLFVALCKRTGLDPFARQIYFTKSKKSGKVQSSATIDGLRLVAHRTGEADGYDGPYWCGDDGVWREAWTEEAPPAASKVVVYRRGSGHPYTGVAAFKSYNKGGNWGSMPDVMLAKCAEAQALRRAFPQELSGVYVAEEVADDYSPSVAAQVDCKASAPAAPSLSLALTAIASASTREQLSIAGDVAKNLQDVAEKEVAREAWEARLVEVKKNYVS